jgi:Spy/CpxP family protein refolding chaperone
VTSRLIQALLALSLLLNTFVLAGFVYTSWIAPPTFGLPPPPPPPGRRPSPIEALVHELDLDDAQRAAVVGLLDSYTTSRRERLREIQRVREQTATEFRRPELDLTRIDGLVDQTARLRADLWKETLRAVAQLEPQLRPDQRERLHELLVERFSGAPPPRPRPPGEPPGSPPPGPPSGPEGGGPGRPPQ